MTSPVWVHSRDQLIVNYNFRKLLKLNSKWPIYITLYILGDIITSQKVLLFTIVIMLINLH